MNNFKLNDSTKKAMLLEKKYMYLIYIFDTDSGEFYQYLFRVKNRRDGVGRICMNLPYQI